MDGNLIYCADDAGAVETAGMIKEKRNDINLIPYGFNAEGKYKIISCRVEPGKQIFSIEESPDFEFELIVPGIHNVRNSTAAIALTQILLADHYKKSSISDFDQAQKKEFLEKTKSALLSFSGSRRRSEIVAKFKNKNNKDCIIVDDYGHHPTAIKTTLEGFRAFYPDKYIIVDFMSHTYSRTAALVDEFASCFDSADQIILHKIYSSARENPADFEGKVSGKILFEKACKNYGNIKYFEEILDASDYVYEKMNSPLPEGKNGYVLITMGAGDNWKLGKNIEKRFSN